MNLDLISFDEHTRLKRVFNIPILNYTDTQVYCLGFFRRPTQEEIGTLSKLPFSIFEPAEEHGWKIAYYSLQEVLAAINESKHI